MNQSRAMCDVPCINFDKHFHMCDTHICFSRNSSRGMTNIKTYDKQINQQASKQANNLMINLS